MTEQTMHEFDAMCLPPIKKYTPKKSLTTDGPVYISDYQDQTWSTERTSKTITGLPFQFSILNTPHHKLNAQHVDRRE